MTTTPAAFAEFGQALAFAEQTLTATLHDHLAERDTKPETWYALKLVATRGPGLSRAALTQLLERSRTMNPDSTRELLARLEADGLIHVDEHVALTAKGEALQLSLREYVTGPTIRLLSQFELDDIETTVRTLQAITARSEEERRSAHQ